MTICSICHNEHNRKNQRYCKTCHAEYMRKIRTIKPELIGKNCLLCHGVVTRRNGRYCYSCRTSQPSEIKFKIAVRDFTRLCARKGFIQKTACEICGDKTVEAHHEDYQTPLKVKWLCIKHHHDLHTKQRNF